MKYSAGCKINIQKSVSFYVIIKVEKYIDNWNKKYKTPWGNLNQKNIVAIRKNIKLS